MATEAQANCPQGQDLFTSCQIAGRATEVFVCSDDQIATYRYGTIGAAPDLVLSHTVADVGFTPWSGVGKEIAESVTFYNGDYSYHVVGGFARPSSGEETPLISRHYGWIDVAQNGQNMRRFECIRDTVGYGFPSRIYDDKMATGLIWDDYSRIWLYDPSHPATPRTGAPALLQEPPSRGADDCLPVTEFNLGGIMMGGPAAKLGELGPSGIIYEGMPEVIEVPVGGFVEIDRFNYNGLRVDTFLGSIIGLQSTASRWKTPSGLKVGLTREDVILILGRVPSGQEATGKTLGAAVCMGDQDDFAKWHAAIEFGHDNRVKSINFVIFSP